MGKEALSRSYKPKTHHMTDLGLSFMSVTNYMLVLMKSVKTASGP